MKQSTLENRLKLYNIFYFHYYQCYNCNMRNIKHSLFTAPRKNYKIQIPNKEGLSEMATNNNSGCTSVYRSRHDSEQIPRQEYSIPRYAKISNSAHIAKVQKYSKSFRDQLDPRDRQIIIPFSFTISTSESSSFLKEQSRLSLSHYSPSTLSRKASIDQCKEESKFFHGISYENMLEQIHSFLSSACQDIISISFKLLNEGCLTPEESKQYAAKNLIANVQILVSETIGGLKEIINEDEIEELACKLTTDIDEMLGEMMKNLAKYYPQAHTIGHSARIRQSTSYINRSEDQNHDLIFKRNIKIDKYLRLSDSGFGKVLNDYNSYTGFIMQVLNAAIMATRENSGHLEETVYEKYVEFNERLFCTSQNKNCKILIDNITKSKCPEYEEELLLNYYSKILKGDDIQKYDYKDYHKKMSNCIERLQNIKEQYQENLQKMKNSNKFSITQKIPQSIKPFNRNDIKTNKFSSNNQSILSIMIKWATSLEEIFQRPEIHIKQRLHYFKNIRNELISPSKQIKDKLYRRLINQYKAVKKQLSTLKEQNALFQSYFMMHSSINEIESYLKRYSEVRYTASQISSSLFSFMQKYLCILIHHLMKAGEHLSNETITQNINLIVLRVNDLLQSKYECSETTFINVLNTLYLLDKSPDLGEKFKLVQVKNKYGQRDNCLVINYVFLNKVQCELEISLQSNSKKQKNYEHFNSFISQMIHTKLGVISECSMLISELDPIINSSHGHYKKSKRKNLKNRNNSYNFKQVYKKDEFIYICKRCKELLMNENIKLFNSDKQFCNKCLMEVQGLEETIDNESIKSYLTFGSSNNLKKIQNYQEIQQGKYVLFFNNDGSKRDTLKLYKIWHHQRQQKWYMININNQILKAVQTDKFEYEQFNYLDIKGLKQKNQTIKELAYIVEQQNLTQLCGIITIREEYLHKMKTLMKKFQSYRIEKAFYESIKTKNEVVDLSNDPRKLKIFEKILDNDNNRQKKGHANRFLKFKNFQFNHIKVINLSQLQLKQIPKNIDKLTNLTQLHLQDNKIKQIDIRQKKDLTSLILNINHLSSIDLTKNTNLTNLQLSSNQITAIDVTKNISLVTLDLDHNQLQSIDLSKNTNLANLYLYNNQFASIDLSKNINLINLQLSHNQLTTIDLTKNTNLTTLNLSSNQLSSVSLNKNINLCNLYLSNNPIISVELTKNISLTTLQLSNAHLTSINISKCINLINLTLNNNLLTSIDLSQNIHLTNLQMCNNKITTIDLTKNTSLIKLDMRDNKLSQIDVSKNLYLTNLTLVSNQLKSIDLSKNTSLIELDLYNNQLTTIDLSKNLNLNNLFLYNNKLTSIDLSGYTNLTHLTLSNNQLTSIDLSSNQKLVNLEVSNNLLTEIDLTKNTKLVDLDLWGNQLKSIDLTNNPDLTNLYLYNNQLTDIDLTHNLNLTNLTLSTNQFTTIDLTKNINLIELDIWGNKLTSIDVSNNIHLTNLYLYQNQLSSIDLSHNGELVKLGLRDNQLTSIDLSKCINLTNLQISSNKITQLDLSNNKLLTELDAKKNLLLTLDLTQNGCLTNVDLENNQLQSVDLTKNGSLNILYLGNNKLTVLDLTGNSQLNKLDLKGNPLESIDFANSKLFKTFRIQMDPQTDKCKIRVIHGEEGKEECKNFRKFLTTKYKSYQVSLVKRQ